MITVLVIVGAVLVGAITALKIIAPLTKTTKDDKFMEYAEKADAIVEPLIKK